MASARTRLQLRTLVRTQLDVDSVEMPDTTLDPWLDDGYDRMLATEERWPFLEDAWTFTGVSNQVGYVKTALQAAHPSQSEIGQITAVTDLTIPLHPITLTAITHDEAVAIFGTGQTGGTVPAYWSQWAGSIELWPAPSNTRTIRVTGFRKGSWAAADATVVDADVRLHLSLFYFGCAMAYAQQEDFDISGQYMNQFHDAVQRAHGKIMAAPQRTPIVMGGRHIVPQSSVVLSV